MVRYCCAELISIHAPRTGSDCKSRSKRLSKRTFQSTLPARGATDPLTNVAISCGSISIHAPRTGSDRNTSHTISTQEHFNPRSPHGERHLQALKVVTDKAFQSTLPARGATLHAYNDALQQAISIHAPRTGSDAPFAAINPPTIGFQSTLPARGATKRSRAGGASGAHFNPRSPHGERHLFYQRVEVWRRISIHAPRTGSDFQGAGLLGLQGYFNPRSPHGERLLS